MLKIEDHKSGSQEPCKKVSQQRARSKPGLGHGQCQDHKSLFTLDTKSGEGMGYLNTQGPTTSKQNASAKVTLPRPLPQPVLSEKSRPIGKSNGLCQYRCPVIDTDFWIQLIFFFSGDRSYVKLN